MKLQHLPLLAGSALLLFSVQFAQAGEATGTPPARPTEAQMKAVHDCAAAKGVEMPAPPAGGPPKGERPADGQKPPQGGGEGKGPHGPKMTDAQRAVMDACFKEVGIEPPKGPRHEGGRMGQRNSEMPPSAPTKE